MQYRMMSRYSAINIYQELAFKLDDNWTILPKLMKVTVGIVTKWIIENEQNPVDIGVEFRITKQSGTILSPAYSSNQILPTFGFTW